MDVIVAWWLELWPRLESILTFLCGIGLFSPCLGIVQILWFSSTVQIKLTMLKVNVGTKNRKICPFVFAIYQALEQSRAYPVSHQIVLGYDPVLFYTAGSIHLLQ